MSDDQFIPLYCALAVFALGAAGLAIWLGVKLRHGTLHLLGPRDVALETDYIVFIRNPEPDPSLEPPSPLLPE